MSVQVKALHPNQVVFRSIFWWLACGMLLLLGACKGTGGNAAALPEPAPTGNNDGIACVSASITNFAGITNIDNVTDSTATIHWTVHPAATGYLLYEIVQGNYIFLNFFAKNINVTTLTGLSSGQTHTFRLVALDEHGCTDPNMAKVSAPLPYAPAVPTSVTLVNPDFYLGYISRPTLAIGSIKNGDTVKLFTDSACTVEVGRQENTTASTTVEVATNTLAKGTYTFYAASVNREGHQSACSTASATYEFAQCREMYVLVAADPALGTGNFCMMATEAKQGENDIPIPAYAEQPWWITPQQAKDACRSVGEGCDIFSNIEWVAAAKQIEAHPANWSNGAVGDGYLNQGHMMCNPNHSLSIEDPTDPWDQVVDPGRFEQRRTFYLPTGIVWDFAGNSAEVADLEIGGSTFTPTTHTCLDTAYDLYSEELDCPALDPIFYTPGNPAGIDHSLYTHANYHIGTVFGTHEYDRTHNNPVMATRGGGRCDPNVTGIFSISLVKRANTTTGFRCICRL